MCWRENLLLSRPKSLVFWFKSICWWRFWKVEDSFGAWRTIRHKWVLPLDIPQRLLISVWVLRTFLFVILNFPWQLFIWSNYGHWDWCLPVILFWLGMKRMLCLCLDHVCLFRTLLHHCFVWLMKHVAAILLRENVHSLEFTTTNVRHGISICLREGKELVTMTITHCGREVPAVRSCVLLCSQVLSVVSLESTIICCAGGSADFIKALDKAPNPKAGSQYPFIILPLHIEKWCTSRASVWWGKLICSRWFGRW